MQSSFSSGVTLSSELRCLLLPFPLCATPLKVSGGNIWVQSLKTDGFFHLLSGLPGDLCPVGGWGGGGGSVLLEPNDTLTTFFLCVFRAFLSLEPILYLCSPSHYRWISLFQDLPQISWCCHWVLLFFCCYNFSSVTFYSQILSICHGIRGQISWKSSL